MPKPNAPTTKPSEPQKVNAYMAKLKHPLTKVLADLRQIILSTNNEIGEEIKGNAPTFFHAGKMKPTEPTSAIVIPSAPHPQLSSRA